MKQAALPEIHPPPAPDPPEITSLIVLCCNALEFTRRCMESVLSHTRLPFELILVDNGSSDGTKAYLENLRWHPGPQKVEIITNPINRGFPAACNQGLQKARGGFLVFLNNDTLVSEGWLEGLLTPLKKDQKIGLAGPVSNYASTPQHVRAKYQTAAELASFASRRRVQHKEGWFLTRRLTSVCVAVKRAVFDQAGDWDERFGIGFFDDDDLCLRAAGAGFRLAVTPGVFIHHFGSQTFKALGLDARRQLEQSANLFRAKWGKEPPPSAPGNPAFPLSSASSTDMVSPGETNPPGHSRPARISLCMIVKNEEANLGPCLESVAALVDEAVVVDTGSSDRTRDIAVQHGARVVEFPWVDSFAAARNESLRHATGDWLLLLDADDRLDAENYARLRSLLEHPGSELVAYVMKVRSRLDPAGRLTRLLDQVRVLPRHPHLHWDYRVHEQIVPSLTRCGGTMRWTDIHIDHTGYQDKAQRRRKLERNLRLIFLDQQERPEDPFVLFNLGRTYLDLGQIPESITCFRRSLVSSSPTMSIVRKLYALLATAHQEEGRMEEAMAACREGLARFPEDAELLFRHSLLLRHQKDLAGAEACLLRLLETRPAAYFDMVDGGVRGYKARHQLALVYEAQNRPAEAETQWQRALVNRPDFVPALSGLGSLFLAQQRWPELEGALIRLETASPDPGQELPVGLLRARGLRARKEYGQARQVLESLCARHPKAVAPRVTLSQVLLEEGHAEEAAEAILRDILALDPQHSDALHNLAVLIRRSARGETHQNRGEEDPPGVSGAG